MEDGIRVSPPPGSREVAKAMKKSSKDMRSWDDFEHTDELEVPQKLVDQVMAASTIENGDLKNLKRAMERTARLIKDYQYNSAGVPSEHIADSRRAMEQLGSILHIGIAYPDKALARAIKLRPKVVKKEVK